MKYMSYQVDVVIVGAGVVGLAVASQVAKDDREVYVLERNETFGKEASSRSSEVISTGVLYPRGSLNARACAEGNILLYELCERHNIAYRKIGKLVVAVDGTEVDELEKHYEEHRKDLADLRVLSQRELKQLEPNVSGVAAIFSPSAGIIDSHGLMRYFLGKARDKGAQIVYKTKVVGIDKVSGGYELEVEEPGGSFSFRSRVVINCAGLDSDKVAAMCGIDVIKAGYKLYYQKGEFYSLSPAKGRMVNYLVYPFGLPKVTGGIHNVPDVWGRTRLGPFFYYVDEIGYAMDSSQKQFFYNSARRLFPFIEFDDIEPESAGIIPRIYDEGEGFRECVIRHEHDKGLPGFINLIGIDCGITGSPAIAKWVSSLVEEALEG